MLKKKKKNLYLYRTFLNKVTRWGDTTPKPIEKKFKIAQTKPVIQKQ